MTGGSPPSLDELIDKVRDVATTLAIRLPYTPHSPPPAEAVNQVKAEILFELKARGKLGAYVIPSRDGLLVVIPSDEDETADEFAYVVEQAVRNSPAANRFNIGGMSVSEFQSAPKITKTVAIDKRRFYSATASERYSLLLERMNSLRSADVIAKPVISTDSNHCVAAAFEYRSDSEGGRKAHADYRDPYFEDNPNLAAIDLQLIRRAAERLAEEFGTEGIQTKYVSVVLANVLDRRYWLSYAMEYRNIPAFLREHMVLEIVRLPHGTPGGRIQEIVHRHREFFDNISIRIPAELDFTGVLTPFPGFRQVAISMSAADEAGGLRAAATCACRLHRLGFDVRLVDVPDHLMTDAGGLPFVKLLT